MPSWRRPARALEAGKPIVAIKTGATAKSQAAAQSHTGAIGGDYAAYLAMCERYGIVNCRNLDDMMEAALAFDGGRLPKGPRIGFVTTSGGTVDLLYDYAEAEGSPMPDYAPETLKGLMPFMQEGIEPKNPLDLGIPGGLKQAAGVCEVVAKDPNIDMIAWAAMLPSKAGAWDGVEALQAMVKRHRQADRRLRPHELPDDAGGGRSADAGRLPVPAGTGADVARAQRAVVPRAAHRQAAGDAAPCPAERSVAGDARRHAQEIRHRAAAEPRGRDRRGSRGCGRGDRLSGGAENPLADILHKTEAGGVALDLRSRDAVLKAADDAHRFGTRRLSGRPHRRLPGAGDGVGRRGDRRRAHRQALRPDAAGRRRRHPGRARQGRGAAPAAGDEDRRGAR